MDLYIDGLKLKMAQLQRQKQVLLQKKFDADATHDIRQDGDGLGLDIRVDGLSLKMA